MDLMASWLWKHFEEYVRKHLARHGKREPSPEELRTTFEAVWRESSATLLVQEPWMGTIRFKTLARLRPETAEPFLADPMGYIVTHYGGGKFKVNFHHGLHFVGTRNFKPEGEPKWQALPELTED